MITTLVMIHNMAIITRRKPPGMMQRSSLLIDAPNATAKTSADVARETRGVWIRDEAGPENRSRQPAAAG